jgi:hypothetical protein
MRSLRYSTIVRDGNLDFLLLRVFGKTFNRSEKRFRYFRVGYCKPVMTTRDDDGYLNGDFTFKIILNLFDLKRVPRG